MPAEKALAFDDRKQLSMELIRQCRPGDVLLFKGSRGMHMELVMEQFLER